MQKSVISFIRKIKDLIISFHEKSKTSVAEVKTIIFIGSEWDERVVYVGVMRFFFFEEKKTWLQPWVLDCVYLERCGLILYNRSCDRIHLCSSCTHSDPISFLTQGPVTSWSADTKQCIKKKSVKKENVYERRLEQSGRYIGRSLGREGVRERQKKIKRERESEGWESERWESVRDKESAKTEWRESEEREKRKLEESEERVKREESEERTRREREESDRERSRKIKRER